MATLITGASSGIGEILARRFAERGDDLILVARRADRLERLAEEIRSRYGRTATVIAMDLATPDAAQALWQQVNDHRLPVEVLINNAGFGTHGLLADADPELMQREITLNCQTLVGTTTRFLPEMVRRDRGTIINLSSIAGFQPVPRMAVYSATKAFVKTFTEALWGELSGTGIRVLAVCPGPTDTPFFEIAGEAAAAGRMTTPESLVDNIFAALETSKPSFVDGWQNAFVHRVLPRLLPSRLVIKVAGYVVRGDGAEPASRSTARVRT